MFDLSIGIYNLNYKLSIFKKYINNTHRFQLICFNFSDINLPMGQNALIIILNYYSPKKKKMLTAGKNHPISKYFRKNFLHGNFSRNG